VRLGWNFFGTDRAFRSYYVLPVDNERLLLLIERPEAEEIADTCNKPTPLPADEKDDEVLDEEKHKEQQGQQV